MSISSAAMSSSIKRRNTSRRAPTRSRRACPSRRSSTASPALKSSRSHRTRSVCASLRACAWSRLPGILRDAGLGTAAADFLTAAKAGPWNYDFLKDRPAGASLEGFLFPDTYKFTDDADAKTVIKTMLDTYQIRWNAALESQPAPVAGQAAGRGGEHVSGGHPRLDHRARGGLRRRPGGHLVRLLQPPETPTRRAAACRRTRPSSMPSATRRPGGRRTSRRTI